MMYGDSPENLFKRRWLSWMQAVVPALQARFCAETHRTCPYGSRSFPDSFSGSCSYDQI